MAVKKKIEGRTKSGAKPKAQKPASRARPASSNKPASASKKKLTGASKKKPARVSNQRTVDDACVARVYAKLRERHPDAHCELNHANAFQLLVATVLSAQSTDVMVNKVTPELFRRWPTPERLAEADPAAVELALSKVGMYRQKTKNVIGLSKRLVAEHGGSVPRSLSALVLLPGVGRKTANVVLGVAFGTPEGVVVDTHVQRISQRLGWTRHSEPPEIEGDLMALCPRTEWDMLSHTLIFHGRRVCTAHKPACAACPVNVDCPSAFHAENVGRKRARERGPSVQGVTTDARSAGHGLASVRPRKKTQKVKLAAALSSFALLLPHSARAQERQFGFDYQSSVLTPGSAQIAPWTTVRAGRTAYYNETDARIAFDYGIAQNLQGTFFWNFSSVAEDLLVPGASQRTRLSDSQFDSFSLAFKYKLSDPIADALGSALYVEGTFGPLRASVEGRLIGDDQLGPLLLSVNLLGTGTELLEGRSQSQLGLAFVAGAGYFVTPLFALTLELRSENQIGHTLERSALYLGPGLSLAYESWWATLSLEPQIVALKGASGGRRYDLDQNERLDARVLFGFRL
jgi:endonuclease-3